MHPAHGVGTRLLPEAGRLPRIRGAATCELGAGAVSDGSTRPTGALPPSPDPWITVAAMTLAATIAAAATPKEPTPGPRGRSTRLPGRLDCAASWAADVTAAGIEPGSVSRPRRDAAPAAVSVVSPDVRSTADVGSKRPWAQRCADARRNLAAAGETLRRLDGRLGSPRPGRVLAPNGKGTRGASYRLVPAPNRRRTDDGLGPSATDAGDSPDSSRLACRRAQLPPLLWQESPVEPTKPRTRPMPSHNLPCHPAQVIAGARRPAGAWRPGRRYQAYAHGVLDDATTVGARITATPRFHGAWRTS